MQSSATRMLEHVLPLESGFANQGHDSNGTATNQTHFSFEPVKYNCSTIDGGRPFIGWNGRRSWKCHPCFMGPRHLCSSTPSVVAIVNGRLENLNLKSTEPKRPPSSSCTGRSETGPAAGGPASDLRQSTANGRSRDGSCQGQTDSEPRPGRRRCNPDGRCAAQDASHSAIFYLPT